MSIDTTTLNFNSTSFLGYLDSRWVLTNAVIDSNGRLVISSGGNAVLTLTAEVNAECKYIKTFVEYSCTGVSSENNYKSDPTILIKEVYKNSSNVIDKVYVRALGLNTFETTTNGYSDTTLYATYNKAMSSMVITITNNTGSDLTIYSIAMYKSIDISESQVSTLVQSVNKSGSAESFKVYHNSDTANSLQGIGVFIQNSTTEIKYKPSYYAGQLVAILTNTGQTISVQHLIEEMNLDT